jgi:serine/threonine protein kinase
VSGRYGVEQVVVERPLSVVYRARHSLWNRPVAVKCFRGLDDVDVDGREAMLREFARECARLADLSERTTGIVQARDMGTLTTDRGDWVPYLVLEWLDGEPLHTVLWKERGLVPLRTIEQAVVLLEPVARALALAHVGGLCHGDLRPSKVFVMGDPRSPNVGTKLLDFGVAGVFEKARGRPPTRAERDPCDEAYFAPEQISDAYGIPGPWTDVFAMALLFVEVVAGREPVQDAVQRKLEHPVGAARPRDGGPGRFFGSRVSRSVGDVLDRALRAYPVERWQTVGAFWSALRDALGQAPQPLTTRVTRSRSVSAALELRPR